MTHNEISTEEMWQLESVRNLYVEDNLSFLTGIVISASGLSLATLSSTALPDIFNLSVIIISLLIILILIVYTKYRKTPFTRLLKGLREKYPNHERTQKYLDEIDPWKGFHLEKRKLWTATLISLLFMIYAIFEHGARIC